VTVDGLGFESVACITTVPVPLPVHVTVIGLGPDEIPWAHLPRVVSVLLSVAYGHCFSKTSRVEFEYAVTATSCQPSAARSSRVA
jgi:hypothetical protein